MRALPLSIAPFPRVVRPRAERRHRTERDRFLAALAVVDADRWPLTWQHMADKLFAYDTGRITRLF